MSISVKKFRASMLSHAGAWTLAAVLAACGGGGTGNGNVDRTAPSEPAGLTYDVIPLSLGGVGTLGFVGREDITANGKVAGTIDAADGRRHAFLYDGEKMIDLGTLGGLSSEAGGLNELGQVVGWVELGDGSIFHTFLYDGTMHDLGTLGGTQSFGRAINDRGQVTGESLGADGMRRAFLYQNGVMSALPTPGVHSAGRVINASGVVGGIYNDANAFARGFVVGACQCPKDLGTLGGNQTFVFAINDAGQVAGISEDPSRRFRAFRYEDGAMKDLGTLGGDQSTATSINESGWVTGFAATSTGRPHAFVHDGKTMRDLGTLGGEGSEGTAINAAGQVVGNARTASGEGHAMTWTEAGGMIDLNTVLHNPPPGLVLTTGFAISDNGSIVAQANPGLVLLKPRYGQQK
jgi:probable HAF family extracellular repeat protein